MRWLRRRLARWLAPEIRREIRRADYAQRLKVTEHLVELGYLDRPLERIDIVRETKT